MFGSEVLDVAIGLALVFLVLSFMASAIREAIESLMKSRAVYLERAIRELVDDPDGTGMAKEFYEHPLIYSLYQGQFEYKKTRWSGGGLPAYIPARNFAQTIVDLAVRGPVRQEYAAAQVAPALSVSALRANISRLRNPRLIRAVLTAIDHSQEDVSKVVENLQAWFDSSMDRVSGWYKRSTHFWLFGIGFGLAVILNVDTVRLTERLWRDKTLRQTITTRAEAIARDTLYQRQLVASAAYRDTDVVRASRDLGALKLPIGWTDSSWTASRAAFTKDVPSFFGFWFLAVLGYLPAALAVTLGAPFWFDALNRIMVIRSTVKPHEKSPEEGSEDRQKGSAGPSSGTAVRPGQRTAASVAAPASVLTAAASGMADVHDPEHTPHEWATGEPDEGII